MKMYPAYQIAPGDSFPLSSFLFGHRLRTNQTPIEYLIEFLQVMLAEKRIEIPDSQNEKYEYFPSIPENYDEKIAFRPNVGIGLKRFIFFNHSKPEGKANVDKDAYQACIKVLQNHIESDDAQERKQLVSILQDLFFGFNATPQARSWFDKNMLPICPEVILPEGMGVRTVRNGLSFSPGSSDIDKKFSYDRYTYMCRGGEVYYLHLLNGINRMPDDIVRNTITKHFRKLLTESFPQFSQLSTFVEKTWEEYMSIDDDLRPEKKLAWIPSGYSCRSQKTAREICTLLQCAIHPFEKIQILSDGIIIQLMRVMYEQASNIVEQKSDLWVLDLCKDDPEMRKIAAEGFVINEDGMQEYLRKGFAYFKNKPDLYKAKDTDGKKDISDAADVSYKLCRKLGKQLGFIIPIKGSYMRFTLNERILKFMVLSLIEPKKKVTFDRFLELLNEHFGIVVDRTIYFSHVKDGNLLPLADYSVLDKNKQAMLELLKNCGFLRNLSDATSIVENPFEMEVI